MAKLKNLNSIGVPGTLGSNNPESFPVIFGDEVGGWKSVPTINNLFEIPDVILSKSGNNQANDAIGQEWYISTIRKKYALIDWNNRKSQAGWKEVSDSVGSQKIIEIENKLNSFITGLQWKQSVENEDELRAKYPYPEEGWTVSINSTNEVLRYDAQSRKWIRISFKDYQVVSNSTDGLMSHQDKLLLTIESGTGIVRKINVEYTNEFTSSFEGILVKINPITTLFGKSPTIQSNVFGDNVYFRIPVASSSAAGLLSKTKSRWNQILPFEITGLNYDTASKKLKFSFNQQDSNNHESYVSKEFETTIPVPNISATLELYGMNFPSYWQTMEADNNGNLVTSIKTVNSAKQQLLETRTTQLKSVSENNVTRGILNRSDYDKFSTLVTQITKQDGIGNLVLGFDTNSGTLQITSHYPKFFLSGNNMMLTSIAKPFSIKIPEANGWNFGLMGKGQAADLQALRNKKIITNPGGSYSYNAAQSTPNLFLFTRIEAYVKVNNGLIEQNSEISSLSIPAATENSFGLMTKEQAAELKSCGNLPKVTNIFVGQTESITTGNNQGLKLNFSYSWVGSLATQSNGSEDASFQIPLATQNTHGLLSSEHSGWNEIEPFEILGLAFSGNKLTLKYKYIESDGAVYSDGEHSVVIPIASSTSSGLLAQSKHKWNEIEPRRPLQSINKQTPEFKLTWETWDGSKWRTDYIKLDNVVNDWAQIPTETSIKFPVKGISVPNKDYMFGVELPTASNTSNGYVYLDKYKVAKLNQLFELNTKTILKQQEHINMLIARMNFLKQFLDSVKNQYGASFDSWLRTNLTGTGTNGNPNTWMNNFGTNGNYGSTM